MNVIIDCDAGMDDAIAIALAASAPALLIDSITTVAGNAPIAVTTANALATIAALGLDLPVFRGSAGPDGAAGRFGIALWGGDGSLGLAPAGQRTAGDALGHLERRLEVAAPGSVTLCPIGPLTNIAALLDRRPELSDRIARLVVMGGAFKGGNVTEHAEFNIWFDPPAAARTFASDCPATIVPYDLTQHIVVDTARIAQLAGAATPAARLAARLLPLAGTNSHATSIHDAVTIGWLLWPELFDSEHGIVSAIDRRGEEFGRTLFDPDPAGRHQVLTGVDREAFLDRMVAMLAGAAG
jgi:purine nucleosidase